MPFEKSMQDKINIEPQCTQQGIMLIEGERDNLRNIGR